MEKSHFEQTLELLQRFSDKRIQAIEILIGEGDEKEGRLAIKSLLRYLVKEKFLSHEIGKMVKKQRHTIHKWYRRYKIEPIKHYGNKKSIIILTKDEEKHETKHARYEKVGDRFYRTYYVFPTPNFAYLLGLVLGDGHPDDCKTYIVGGKPFDFLDKIHPVIRGLVRDLGTRTVKIIYFTKNDKRVDRNNPKVSYWRIYIYWSAFTHLFEDKEVLKRALEHIWSERNLFNAFTAGLFDADGYFTMRYGKPERIGLDQTDGKWWFPLFCEELGEKYNLGIDRRTRRYTLFNRERVYTGVSKSSMIRLKMSSWVPFIDEIVRPYCNKTLYRIRGDSFKEHSLRNPRRWR